MKVFVLHHTYGPASSETYKLLGVFSSESSALEAERVARSLPGFRDYPDGFTVDVYDVDERCWSEGFGTNDLDRVTDKRRDE